MASEETGLISPLDPSPADIIIALDAYDLKTQSDGQKLLQIQVTEVQSVGLDKRVDYIGIQVSCASTKWTLVRNAKHFRELHANLKNLLPPDERVKLDELYPFANRRLCGYSDAILARELPAIEKYLQLFTGVNGWLGTLSSLGAVREFLNLKKPFAFIRNNDLAGFNYCFMGLNGTIVDEVFSAVDKAKANIFHYIACQKNSAEFVKFIVTYLDSQGRKSDISRMIHAKDVFGLSPVQLSIHFKNFDEFVSSIKNVGVSIQDFSDEKEESVEFAPPIQYTKAAIDISYKFLVNPIAGQGRAVRVYKEVIDPLLRLKGVTKYTSQETEYQGHGTKIVQEIDLNTYDAVIAIGGDGTLMEILNGLGNEKINKVPLGVIPSGSGNGIAASLGWKTPEDAVVSISDGEFSTIDTFKFTQLPESVDLEAPPIKGILFLLVSWGMLSDIDFGSEKWRWMGEFRFTLMGAIKVISNESYPSSIHYLPEGAPSEDVKFENGKFVVPASFKTLENPHFLCGSSGSHISTSTKIAPDASLNDGRIWLITASNMNFFQRVGFLLGIEDGSHAGKEGVRIVPTTQLIIDPKKYPQIMDIDGERYPNTAILVESAPEPRPRFAC